MIGVPSVCNKPGCPRLTNGPYCAEHARTSTRNHRGVPRQARGYDAGYERRRRELIGLPCHWCGAAATTADHLVPLSRGGSTELVPSCGHCNYGRGARLMLRARGTA